MYKADYITSSQRSFGSKPLASRKLYAMVVLWLFVLAQNADFSSNQLVWWGSVAVFIVGHFLSYRLEVYFDNYSFWLFVFMFFSLLSFVWAITPEWVLDTMKSMVVHGVIFILLRSSIRTQKDVEFLLKLLLIACVINATYLFFTNMSVFFDQTQEVGDRLGTQKGWNANTIGMMMSLGSILSLYFFRKATKKKSKFFFVLIIVALAIVSLVTGSRKAVVILMGGIAAYIFLSSKGKRIRALLLCILLLIFLWFLIMENSYFYSIVGWRVESFLSQFTGEGILDNSTKTRQTLLAAAVEAWLQKPILGHGLDCFRYFGRIATGHDYYAHNNYVELLADLGIVGFISYYSGYFYVLINSWKKKENELSLLFFVLVCVMMVTEFACVTYVDFFFGVLMVLMFANCKCSKVEKQEDE